MRGFPSMLLEELLIDRFTPPKTLVRAMPEADSVLSEFPAEAYIAVPVAGHEVQQPDIQVFYQGASLLNIVQGLTGR